MAPAPLSNEGPSGGGWDLSIFDCGLCSELVFEPVTLACCGSTYCLSCLQGWYRARAETVGVLRCPGATCDEPLSFRLPAVSRMVQAMLEAAAPAELERRRADLQSDDGEGAEEELPGGFVPWEEVAATMPLTGAHGVRVVEEHTPGVVIGSFTEGRVTVKFDRRADGHVNCVNVYPREIRRQPPRRSGFRCGQAVAATKDLMFGNTRGVFFGVRGVVRGAVPGQDNRVEVLFETRADGQRKGVNVLFNEIAPATFFNLSVGQRVSAVQDMKSSDGRLIVTTGTIGTVIAPYSDTRVTVRFDERADGQSHGVNVLPREVQPAASP